MIRWWWMWSSRWNENWQGKPKYSEETCPNATLPATNPTWPDLCSNPGCRGVMQATNRLSSGTAPSLGLLSVLKDELVHSFGTLLNVYQTTRRHIPGGRIVQISTPCCHRCSSWGQDCWFRLWSRPWRFCATNSLQRCTCWLRLAPHLIRHAVCQRVRTRELQHLISWNLVLVRFTEICLRSQVLMKFWQKTKRDFARISNVTRWILVGGKSIVTNMTICLATVR
jgi:hypothetical protein